MMSDFDKLLEAIKEKGIQETAYKNIKLNHIINELEKWLKEIRDECFAIYSNPITKDTIREFYYMDIIDKTLNKLQELKKV